MSGEERLDVGAEPNSAYVFRGAVYLLLFELAVVTVLLAAVVGTCLLVGLSLPGS